MFTKFRPRANNHKSTYHNFRKEQKLSNQVHNQKSFHEHYLQSDYNGICDCGITIIDNAETEKSLMQKELYWYHKLKTYAPFGFNEHDVYTACLIRQSFHCLDISLDIISISINSIIELFFIIFILNVIFITIISIITFYHCMSLLLLVSLSLLLLLWLLLSLTL